MNWVQLLNTGLNLAGVLGIIAGVYVYFKFRVTSATVKMYQDNQQAFEARITELERQHSDNQLQITALKSELEVIKTLPLSDIDNKLTKLFETQNTILSTQSVILQHFQSAPLASPVTVNTAAPIS